MRKCAICGAVNSEKDDDCGVCGTSLADFSAESAVVPSTRHPATPSASSLVRTSRSDRYKQGIMGLLFGIGMMAIGVLMLELIALVGILMLLFGFIVIVTDLSWMRGNTFLELDEPILHGRAPIRGYLHYPSREGKEERAETETPLDSSSEHRDENHE